MPIKLIAPIIKEFTLVRSDARFGNEGEPTRVTIRQATQEQHELRSDVNAEVRRKWDSEEQSVVLSSDYSPARLERAEVYLTMVDCNILDENGEQLFRFKKVRDGKQVLDMTQEQFRKAWGQLEPSICEEIHEKVLEVNLSWGNPLES